MVESTSCPILYQVISTKIVVNGGLDGRINTFHTKSSQVEHYALYLDLQSDLGQLVIANYQLH